MKLLVFIKDEKYVGWKNLTALNVIRLYINKRLYKIGSQCSFMMPNWYRFNTQLEISFDVVNLTFLMLMN